MQILPIGFLNAHFIFACTGVQREMSWSCAFEMPDPPRSPDEVAIDLYDFAKATGSFANAGAMSPEYKFLGVRVEVQTDTLGLQVGEWMQTVTGSLPAAATALPPNCAILLRKQTARGGRRGRGRAFLPPYNAGEATFDAAGIFVFGTESTVQTLYNSFFTACTSDDLQAHLLHNETIDPATGEVDPAAPAPPAPDLITSFSVHRQLATQRRRMR